MSVENPHRLLKRQLKKSNFTESELKRLGDFLSFIDASYKRSDQDRIQLENILELSSQELFNANQKLTQDVKFKTQEVSKAKAQLNRVVDNVKEIIFQADLNGDFIYLNSAWEKITGFPVEETLGNHFTGFFKNIDSRDLKTLEELQNIGNQTVSRTFRTLENGITRWFEITIKSTKDEEGKPDGFIGAIVEITSLKEVEKELIHANQVKDNFLSAMSHEIRTPLNAVIGISNMLLMDNPKQDQIENLNALKFSSKHLLNLINDVLDFSKLKVGKIPINNDAFDLRETLFGLEKSFSFTAKEKRLNLHFNCEKGVPSRIIGDNLRVSQVLTNLLSNALKFTMEGTVTFDAKLLSKSEEKVKILFSVTDTGIGIAKQNIEKVFERFTQAENHTAKQFGGTGLGLSISKKLIELMGGELNLESEFGKGTVFSFELDFKYHNDLDSPSVRKKNVKSNDISNLKVLIAEDNPMNILVLKNFLGKWGVEFDIAENGQVAVEKIVHNDYSLILMDLQMPIMDGYSSAREIRKIPGVKFSSIPIIALSASVSSNVIQKVRAAGMDDYLSKPFNPEDLKNLLSQYQAELVLV